MVHSSGLYRGYGLFSDVLQGKMQSRVILPCQSKPGADISSPILFSSMAVKQSLTEGILFGGDPAVIGRQ